MINQVIIVGRLVNDIKVEKNDEKTTARLTLAVNRYFKNADGIYETDFIDCILWSSVAQNTAEYCNKGDIISIRGRLQSKMEDNHRITEVIADKVTFLSKKKTESGDDLSA